MAKNTPKRGRTQAEPLSCVFCGASEEDAAHLITGDPLTFSATVLTSPVEKTGIFAEGSITVSSTRISCICDECVGICVDVLAETKKSGAAATAPPKTQKRGGKNNE